VRLVSRTLWVAPFLVHLAYVLATLRGLPDAIGARPWAQDPGTSAGTLLVEWLTIVGLANLALLAVHLRLPRASDRLLSVPGKAVWLSSEERRAELVERLRGFLETALVLLNVFFLAVYQGIYQSAVPHPVLTVPFAALAFGFMGVPLALIAAAFVKLVVSLGHRESR
jgi:hypothetical protein